MGFAQMNQRTSESYDWVYDLVIDFYTNDLYDQSNKILAQNHYDLYQKDSTGSLAGSALKDYLKNYYPHRTKLVLFRIYVFGLY